MRIQLPTTSPTCNAVFVPGHLYKHQTSDHIYLHAKYGDKGRGILVNIKDGQVHDDNFNPAFFHDITDHVSVQEIKK